MLIGGFQKFQETGLEQLHTGCELNGSLRQILCTMILLGFHLFVSYVLGYGDGDLVLAERLINEQLSVSWLLQVFSFVLLSEELVLIEF